MKNPDKFSKDRRNLFKMSLLAGASTTLTLPLYAKSAEARDVLSELPAHALPVVDARFPSEIAPGVFLIPDKRIPLVPNIGIVVGTETALIVDCGLGISSAEHVLDMARKLAPGRKLILTVTHAHPEHGFGAQVFKKDALIYYNELQRDYFLQSGKTLLEGFRKNVLPPDQKYLLDNIELTPPHKTYRESQTTLDLGGRKVHLGTWGTAHSPGDQVVYLPEEKIVFAGDLLEERMFPIVPVFPPMITQKDIDVHKWELALKDIISWQPRLIVPGHGNLAGKELPEAVLGYFAYVREQANMAGESLESNEVNIRQHYPSWENAEYIPKALAYFKTESL